MEPLISPEWLAARIQDSNTIVLDATLPPVGVTPPIDTHARYPRTPITRALFVVIEDLSHHSPSLPHMLSTPEGFSRDMSALGVSDDMTIVVYEQQGVFSAPRAWWTLRPVGARHVYILDGGLRAWTESGFRTESGPVYRAPATFNVDLNRE